MAFWNSSDIKINQKYQYKLEIGGVIWYAKTVKFPSISNEIKEFSTFSGGPPEYIPGTTKIDSFGVTMADIYLEGGDGGTPGYNISTSAFFFWIFKRLEESVNDRLLPIAGNDGVYEIEYPFSQAWERSNLGAGTDGKLGTITEIVITKFYGNVEQERIRFFECIPTKLDLGQGDYNSDDINEITIDFQPKGFRVETIETSAGGEETIKQKITPKTSSSTENGGDSGGAGGSGGSGGSGSGSSSSSGGGNSSKDTGSTVLDF